MSLNQQVDKPKQRSRLGKFFGKEFFILKKAVTRHNKIWKKITHLADNAVTEELVAENNAIMMYNPLIGK